MTTFIYKTTWIGLFSLTLLFSSCDKQYFNKEKDDIDFKTEVLGEEETLLLPSSNYETHIISTPEFTYGSDYYTKGTLGYSVDNTLYAQIDFGNGTINSSATLTVNNTTSTIALAKQNSGSVYSKVIVNPIIKTSDCAYIVQGTVKYYDVVTGDLVATIDFGNGECDALATKTWPSGTYGGKTWSGGSKTFNMNDWINK